MCGCLIGLHWAAQIDKGEHFENVQALGAAHNILGVTFHAIQDFYSHSNWIDPVHIWANPGLLSKPVQHSGLTEFFGIMEKRAKKIANKFLPLRAKKLVNKNVL